MKSFICWQDEAKNCHCLETEQFPKHKEVETWENKKYVKGSYLNNPNLSDNPIQPKIIKVK